MLSKDVITGLLNLGLTFVSLAAGILISMATDSLAIGVLTTLVLMATFAVLVSVVEIRNKKKIY